MYYCLLIFATFLYSLSFYFNRNVERQCENGIDTAILFSTVAWAEILIILLAVMGGNMQFSPFSLACAVVHSAFLIGFSFLNLKALSVADLSKYSMFTMLGGMILPFIFGILLFDEGITLGKALCCIMVSLALYIESYGGKISKKAIFYLLAVFVVNGSFGVISAIHQNSAMRHVDTLQYMSMQAIIISLFGCIWFAVKKFKKKAVKTVKNKKAYVNMLLYGIVNGGAELILLFAIKEVPATVQYTITTGGVIIFSTIISMIIGENRNAKSLIPVGITFVGLLLLML